MLGEVSGLAQVPAGPQGPRLSVDLIAVTREIQRRAGPAGLVAPAQAVADTIGDAASAAALRSMVKVSGAVTLGQVLAHPAARNRFETGLGAKTRTELVRALVERGADLFALTEGEPPFTLARYGKHDAICDYLGEEMRKRQDQDPAMWIRARIKQLRAEIARLEKRVELL